MMIVVEAVPRTGPRGDRDAQRHPYHDYRVHVAESVDATSTETVIREVSGVDHWRETIRPIADVKPEVREFADRLAGAFGVPVAWMPSYLVRDEFFTDDERAWVVDVISAQTGCRASEALTTLHFLMPTILAAAERRVKGEAK
jgi:hypothetical protein